MLYFNKKAYDMLLILGEYIRYSWKIMAGTLSWSDSSLVKRFFTFG